MTVRTRLVSTFAIVVGLLAVPAVFAAVRLDELRDIAVEERGRHARAALALGRMQASTSELDILERSYLAGPNEQRRQDIRAVVARLEGQLDTLRDTRYAESSTLVEPTVAQLRERTEVIERLVGDGRMQEATDEFNIELEALFAEMSANLGVLADSVDAIAQRDFRRAEMISESALYFTVGSIITGLLLAILAGAWTTRALTRPLRRLATGTGAVADGSFEAPRDLPYSRDDEIGELSRAFRTMTYRLAELDRMKTEFVSVASHELKNPVHVIRGYAELLDEEIPGELNPRQREMVKAVSEQTRIMGRLITRLMDIGRLESGTYELRLTRVDVQELVDALVRSFGVLAEKKGVSLESEVGGSTPGTIEADADLLRDEILGNLVSNAVKHTPKGGHIVIRTRGDGRDVVFEVSDDGPGIPAEDRPRIFRKYYQVERTGAEGSGLGLAVAKEMVEAHGGRIELDPDASPGATFRVVLPAGGGDVREPSIQVAGRVE